MKSKKRGLVRALKVNVCCKNLEKKTTHLSFAHWLALCFSKWQLKHGVGALKL